MKIKLSITLLSLFFSGNIYAGWLDSPNNYDECILESMKGVTSDKAAKLINRSCRKKFPTKSPSDNTVDLPQDALQKLEGNAGIIGIAGQKRFSVTLFNGNNNWHITSLVIRIADKKTQKHRDYATSMGDGVDSFGIYTSSIPPSSKGDMYFDVFNPPKDWSWSKVSGEGYKK